MNPGPRRIRVACKRCRYNALRTLKAGDDRTLDTLRTTLRCGQCGARAHLGMLDIAPLGGAHAPKGRSGTHRKSTRLGATPRTPHRTARRIGTTAQLWGRRLVQIAALLIASAAALIGCLHRNWPSWRQIRAALNSLGPGLVQVAALLLTASAAFVRYLRRSGPRLRRQIRTIARSSMPGLVQVTALLIASAALLGAYVGAAGVYAGIAHTVRSVVRTMANEATLSIKEARLAEFCSTRIDWLEGGGPTEPATRSRAYDHLQRTCSDHGAAIISLRQTAPG